MTARNPVVSVIIVNWNTRDLLAGCLQSLLKSGIADDTEIIVVDNASTDASGAMVQDRFPGVRLLANSENVGYSRANNQGLTAARGTYLVLLNSDTVTPGDVLGHMVEFLRAHPRIGVVGPRLQLPDGRAQQYGFGKDPTLWYLLRRGTRRLFFNKPLHDWETSSVLRVDWVSGACLMVRREAYEQVGGLDESFFMYFEDADWCRRIRLAGWDIAYDPRVSVIHFGGESLKQNPRAGVFYQESLRRYYRKHFGRLQRWLLVAGLRVYGWLARVSRRA